MELKVQKLVSEKYLEKPRCRKERYRSVLRDMTVSILDLNIRGLEWMQKIYFGGSEFIKLPLTVWSEYLSGYFRKDIFEKYLSDYQSDSTEDKKHPFTMLSKKESDDYEQVQAALQSEMNKYLICNGYVYKKKGE